MEENRTGFWKALGLMWKRGLNFRDTADKQEYIWPVLFHFVLGILGLAAVLLLEDPAFAVKLIVWIDIVYLILSVVPLLALTVRRLHATGRSGWWSCLVFAIGVGMIALFMMCASSGAGSFNPYYNEPVDVYGPPPMEEYNPGDNEIKPMYGPSWDLNPDESIFSPSVTPSFDPADNEPVCVYGPPEWFTNEEVTDENESGETDGTKEQ